MRAAVFVGARRPFEIREYPAPAPPEGHAVVELATSGICGTDVHIWDGAIAFNGPMILGHEFLGAVRAIGAGPAMDCVGRPVSVGDRVAVNVIEACGACRLCREGGAASCLRLAESLTYTRTPDEPPHLHGGFAEGTVCPTRYLHRLPEELPTEVAAAFLCAGPTVVRGLAYAGGVRQGETVVVQGGGPVGLWAVLHAGLLGAARVIVILSGSHPLRAELACALGADAVLDIRTTTIEERRQAVLDATGGIGADLVIEGTGSPDAALEGLALLRPRGRAVWVGQYSDRGPTEIPTHLVTFNALQVFGSAQFTVEDRSAYFDALLGSRHSWDAVRRVVTHRFTVDQADEAIATVRGGRAVKAVFASAPRVP